MRMENNEEKLIKDVVPLTNLEDIVANCVIDPIGFASPLREASVPTIIVVATAPPTPTTSTPRRPVAGLISCFISILLKLN